MALKFEEKKDIKYLGIFIVVLPSLIDDQSDKSFYKPATSIWGLLWRR